MKAFREWFEVKVHSVVMDSVKGDIQKEGSR